MVEDFSRHDYLNHRTTILALLQEIQFISEDKAAVIYREINNEMHWYQDFSFFFFLDNRLHGFLFAREKKENLEIGRTIEIKYLAVREESQHQGIAGQLMDFLISRVKFTFSNIVLTCYEENEKALQFYHKSGFIPWKKENAFVDVILDRGTPNEHRDIYFIKRFPLQNVLIRPLRSFELDFLKEMVFLSLFKLDGTFDRSILESKEIKRYYDQWDVKKDIAYVALFEEEKIGAIWCRFFPFYDQGHGFVNDDIPEMAMAVKENYRNRGLGQQLLDHLVTRLKHQNVKGLSLSVHERNPAKKLYERNQFLPYRHEGDSIIMLKKLI